MVRMTRGWYSWVVAAAFAAIPSIAHATPEDVEEDTEEVAETESAFVGVGGYSAAAFPFVTIVPDDGTDVAGGWQAAVAMLSFYDGRGRIIPDAWSCQVFVGMPIRHTIHGVIIPPKAATVTAAAATDASRMVMHRQSKWLRATFCPAFAAELEAQLNMRMTRLGAKVRAQ